MTALSQDEILQNTRTVVQGLEALKDEHESIKVNENLNLNFLIFLLNFLDFFPVLFFILISENFLFL